MKADICPTTRWTPLIADLFAAGIPKAQPRPRAWARVIAGKPTARMYDAGTAEAWKADIARAFEGCTPPAPLDGPIRIDADFIFPRPGKLLRKCDPEDEIPHIAKPDRDNCEKALLDALKAIGLFRDDCQVCAGEVRKFYAAKTGRPGARITISVPAANGVSAAAPAELFAGSK